VKGGQTGEKNSLYSFVFQENICTFIPLKTTAARLSYLNFLAALIFYKMKEHCS